MSVNRIGKLFVQARRWRLTKNIHNADELFEL